MRAGIYLVVFILLGTFLFRAQNLLSGRILRRDDAQLGYSMFLKDFPSEFLELTNYLQSQPPNSLRVLWYPLNWANYIFIPEGDRSDSAYVGTSIVRDVAYQLDFPGFYYLGWNKDQINRQMLAGNLRPFCQTLWEYGINAIAVNKHLLDERFRNRFRHFFSFDDKPDNMFVAQSTEAFRRTILGGSVVKFGDHYEILSLSPRLAQKLIEVYSGELTSPESMQRNWCQDGLVGLLDSEFKVIEDGRIYQIRTKLNMQRTVSITIPERFGRRFNLRVIGSLEDAVKEIKFAQLPGKYVATVFFKEETVGQLDLQFEDQSFVGQHLTQILSFEILVLILITLALLLSHFRRRWASR